MQMLTRFIDVRTSVRFHVVKGGMVIDWGMRIVDVRLEQKHGRSSGE